MPIRRLQPPGRCCAARCRHVANPISYPTTTTPTLAITTPPTRPPSGREAGAAGGGFPSARPQPMHRLAPRLSFHHYGGGRGATASQPAGHPSIRPSSHPTMAQAAVHVFVYTSGPSTLDMSAHGRTAATVRGRPGCFKHVDSLRDGGDTDGRPR